MVDLDSNVQVSDEGFDEGFNDAPTIRLVNFKSTLNVKNVKRKTLINNT